MHTNVCVHLHLCFTCLSVPSGYPFYQYVCSQGIKPITFCAANAMLYQLSCMFVFMLEVVLQVYIHVVLLYVFVSLILIFGKGVFARMYFPSRTRVCVWPAV